MNKILIKYTLSILLYICMVYPLLQAQDKPPSAKVQDSSFVYNDHIIFEGDTLLIELDEVHLLNKLKFKSHNDKRYYYWFRKKVHNAYPYAKLAQDRLLIINKRLSKIKSKRRRKRYTKRLQAHFKKEFTQQLKQLTRTEGRILIKLIHRQTGGTAYEMLKKLRSGWVAFWNQKTAKLFKLSLKMEYHPESINEDYLIEDILQRAFNDMTLERQESQLDFDFDNITTKANKYIEIER